MLKQSISRNSLLLTTFAIVTTFVIAGTFLMTKDKIKENIRLAQQKALLDIIPKERHNNQLLDTSKVINDVDLLGLREPAQLFIARQNDHNVAIILPAIARDGYTGDIKLLIGINIDGSIAGVRVLSHRETPGLGDAIDLKKSPWVLHFNDKSLINPSSEQWTVKKEGGDFDQFTGATITPRAVIKAVKRALEYFEQHRDEILSKTSTANDMVIDHD